MNNNTLLLDPKDNVGVALTDLQTGQKVSLNQFFRNLFYYLMIYLI